MEKNSVPNYTEAPSPEPKNTTVRSVAGWRWFLVVLGVLSAALLFSLDNSIVADVQPNVVSTFGNVDKLPWLSVAFALGCAATTLIWAAIYSAFNAKYTYIVSISLFTVGSAICGAANTMDVLIFGRALAGVGGSGAYVGVLTLLSALTTPQERPLYVASTGLVWGLGSVLGPLIGGAFADSSATWRWAFYINLVVAGIFAPVYIFMIPSVDPRPGNTPIDKALEFDYIGSVLVMGAFGCGVTGLSFGGSLYSWDSATIIVLLVISVILFTAFGIQQSWSVATSAARRLLPVQYFSDRTLLLMFILTTLSAASIFVPVYFISLYFQFTQGNDATTAAVRLLPFMCMVVFFSLANGAAMGKKGYYAPWFIIASAVALAGSTLMFTVDENTSRSRIYGYSALLGAGAGSVFQTGFIVAQAVVPRSEMSSAVAFMNLAQVGGVILCLTLSNCIFLNLAQSYLTAVLPTATKGDILSAVSGTGSALLNSLTLELRAATIHAVSKAISRTYCLCIATSVLQLLLSLALKWECVAMEM